MNPASAGKRLKLSYCTTCRDRLGDLKQTLSVNLALLTDDEEVVVLDYNSSADPTRQWVLGNFGRDLGAGRLRFYSECSAPRFFMAHAKNVCHLLGDGQVLINLDADNYLDAGYLFHLRRWANDAPGSDMLYPLVGSGGFKGRTAVRRDAFVALGGYDEDMDLGYGYEEIDLYRRLLAGGKRRVSHVAINPKTAIPTPADKKAAGQKEPGTAPADTSLAHRRMCEQNLRDRRLVANAGRPWGVADLTDHEGRAVRTGRHINPLRKDSPSWQPTS